MATSETIARCCNIDWLEVYALESNNHFPCDADYYRSQGYFVRERDYGTRVYNQMFTLEDQQGKPFIEIRRCPKTDSDKFHGLSEFSTHIRLVNRYCYHNSAVSLMREFLLRHDYIFKRIYRIDICLDFTRFDSGDEPARFVRRYIEGKYAKINQCNISAHGQDNWATFEWETLSWGSPKSMVSTKMYNKTKELAVSGHDKPYIRQSWYESGLIDNPRTGEKRNKDGSISTPDVWRVEFSMKSDVDHWVVIENQAGKKVKKLAIPHNLDLFDSRDKIFRRFTELAYHYFHFKKVEYQKDENGHSTDKLIRKDRCPDKVLFKFNLPATFYQCESIASDAKPKRDINILLLRIQNYKATHLDDNVRRACDILIEQLQREDLSRFTEHQYAIEIDALRRAISMRMKYPERELTELAAELKNLLQEGSIF